jgi:hypothetical protein
LNQKERLPKVDCKNQFSLQYQPYLSFKIENSKFTPMLSDCSFKGFRLHGKVQFVDAFPDFTIEYVTSFPDLRVEFVNSFPDNCGQWQEVTAFPDFKVQVVTAFSDLKVEVVTSFPGIA